MDKGFAALFQVHVDFNQSHLFFPKIVTAVLLLLLLVILLVKGIPYLRELRNGTRTPSLSGKQLDVLRFGGTIVLTILYFLSMDTVGEFFPNMGLGFLLTSMPFIFLISLLYVHDLSRRNFLALTLNALIAPTVAWFVLAQLMNITLP